MHERLFERIGAVNGRFGGFGAASSAPTTRRRESVCLARPRTLFSENPRVASSILALANAIQTVTNAPTS
jgi:hypothetical protein